MWIEAELCALLATIQAFLLDLQIMWNGRMNVCRIGDATALLGAGNTVGKGGGRRMDQAKRSRSVGMRRHCWVRATPTPWGCDGTAGSGHHPPRPPLCKGGSQSALSPEFDRLGVRYDERSQSTSGGWIYIISFEI